MHQFDHSHTFCRSCLPERRAKHLLLFTRSGSFALARHIFEFIKPPRPGSTRGVLPSIIAFQRICRPVFKYRPGMPKVLMSPVLGPSTSKHTMLFTASTPGKGHVLTVKERWAATRLPIERLQLLSCDASASCLP